jgi:hypothetical protein
LSKSESSLLWYFKSLEDMCSQFGLNKDYIKDYRVLYAIYDQEEYEGSAFVIVEHIATDDWFEVDSSHCSCDGLSWNLEPTTRKSLIYRAKNDNRVMRAIQSIPEMASLIMLL